ncbi:MAG: nitronate monooxygenase, partial [Pseudomonadota bacterium]
MNSDPIDLTFGGRLRLPLIVAPMFLVSSPALAIAACGRGAIGSFPSHSTRTREDFQKWLEITEQGLDELRDKGLKPAPFAVNLVVNKTNPRFEGDLELCIQKRVEIVLTSKGAPTDVFDRIHSYGGIAFHDVATRRHAEKALAAGADGIVAVCNGAGGHTGQQNPFGLVNEIRQITDKPIVLAG